MDDSDASCPKVSKLDDTAMALEKIFKEIDCYSNDDDGSEAMKNIVDSFSDIKIQDKPALKVPSHTVDLELRRYQKELAKYVCSESYPNTLIVSETNSGKTVVAVEAILKYLQTSPDEDLKCVFITHRVALCEQQYKLICKYVRKETVCICHGEMAPTQNIFLQKDNEHFRATKVFVFTAQTLLNLLKKGTLSIKQFRMLIFDECHHTDSKHPYNMIMIMYLIEKVKHRKAPNYQIKLPQIIGLSASPTVFEQKIMDKSDAEKCLLQLVVNMDISRVSTVQEEKEDLEQHCKTPQEKVSLITMPSNCPFTQALEKFMKAQVDFIKAAQKKFLAVGTDLQNGLAENLATIPIYNSQEFEAWSIKLGKFDSKNPKLQVCLKFSSDMLRKLNGLLRISKSVDSAIILDEIKQFYIRSFIASDTEEEEAEEIDKLYDAFKKIFSIWEKHLENGVDYNKRNKTHSMMNELRRILTVEMELDQSSADGTANQNRGIIFVQTKLEAELLKKWAKRDEQIASLLCPEVITADVKGQTEVLERFEKENCRLLFATSVIEEGIDIPDCKIVVDYHNYINHIQQLQRRGRARMKNGKYFFITCDERFYTAAKTNQSRQTLTEAAIQDLITLMDVPVKAEQIKSEMENQQEVKVKEYLSSVNKDEKFQFKDHLFNFKCGKCLKEVFNSNEVFCFKDNFRIFLTSKMDKKFCLRLITQDPDVKTQKFFDMMQLEANQSIHCKNCKTKLGQLLKFGFFGLPNLTLEQYLVEHSRECFCWKGPSPAKIETKNFKKWKQVQFPQKSIAVNEVKKFFADIFALASESGLFKDLLEDNGSTSNQ